MSGVGEDARRLARVREAFNKVRREQKQREIMQRSTSETLFDGPVAPKQDEDVDVVHGEEEDESRGLATEWADESKKDSDLKKD